MTGPDYWPPNIPRENLSLADKIDALLNDRRLLRATKPTTKHALAALTDTEQAGGRFSTQSGAQATTDYPQQDAATSPWSNAAALPPEPPLGFSVDAIEPMGEPHDVEKAALILAGREASARRGATDAEEGEAITPTSPSSSSSPVPSSEIASSRTPYTAASGVELGTTPLVHRRKVV